MHWRPEKLSLTTEYMKTMCSGLRRAGEQECSYKGTPLCSCLGTHVDGSIANSGPQPDLSESLRDNDATNWRDRRGTWTRD